MHIVGNDLTGYLPPVFTALLIKALLAALLFRQDPATFLDVWRAAAPHLRAPEQED